MRKFNLFSLIAVVLVILAACNQKEGDLTPDNSTVTLRGSLANDAQTKTLLGDDTGASTDVYWSDDESDAFSIEIGGIPYTFKKVGETVNSVTAEFESIGSVPALSEGNYVAKYPASEISGYAAQTGTKEALKNWHYMEASFTASESQTWSDVNLQFQTKVAIVKLTLSNEAFKNQCVTDVSLVSNGTTIIATTSTFTGDDSGNIIAYFAVPSSQFNTRGVSVKATCGGKYYVATLGDKTLQEGKLYRVVKTMTEDVVDLSAEGTSNCYVVSNAGTYKIKTVKGNSNESVGTVTSAVVLWETFGTATAPAVGDLIKADVSCCDGYITFSTNATYKKGNAVIAAKNGETILWSWHIWMADQPEEQVYYNSAGTMMDRNLGATSATPGDVGALGLLYQWGRKDPFLGSSSISSDTEAKSTITWPVAVTSDASTGTIDYVIANPTTFMRRNNSNYDWYYTGSNTTDNTRWSPSSEKKSIYDPCPQGWRVPDGGELGIWSKACGSSGNFKNSGFNYPYDGTHKGINFFGRFGAVPVIWYPAAGCRIQNGGSLFDVGYSSNYWSTEPDKLFIYIMQFDNNGDVSYHFSDSRTSGYSVRCAKE